MNRPEFDHLPGAIAIDLDGTLLNSNTELSVRSRKALEACIARNIPIIIATARAERSARKVIGNDIADLCSLITQNGAIVRGVFPFPGFFKEAMPAPVLEDCISFLESTDPELRLTLEIEGFVFGGNRPRTAEELWEWNAATPEMYLSMKEALALGPAKIAVSCGEKDLSALAGALTRRFNGTLSIAPSNYMTFINITMAHATKPGAIRKLIAPARLTLDDVLAFGDDIPDLDMLKSCGTAVAMANACEEILECTPFHTLSNDEDGVAVVLEQLLNS